MGHNQDTSCGCFSESGRRRGLRICLRKGCGHIFQARRWNQRYCQRAVCQKLVRRWQAAKRQQQRRRRPEVREAHAAAERQRRTCRRKESRQAENGRAENGQADNREPSVGGSHSDDGEDDGDSWSRSRNNSASFCDRPGCYAAVRSSCRCPARYCSDDCRNAVRRVLDRERKWLTRNGSAGRFRRRGEHQASRRAGRARSP